MTSLLSTGHSPSKPAERTLFWLLTGQIQRYEELDLDGSLLVQAQAVASANIRKRLAAAAAAAGRTEWLGAMQLSKPIDQFDANNWSTTVQLLERAGDPQSIWQWALKATPMHAQALLQALPSSTPQPADIPEVAVGLQSLANQLPVVPDRHLLLPNLCTQSLSGHSARIMSIAWSLDGRCLASINFRNDSSCRWEMSIRLWNLDFFSLLTMPLADYTDQQWSALSALQKQAMKLESCHRPWLTFIAALSLLVRRFDFSLDNQSSKTASSIYNIEIDG